MLHLVLPLLLLVPQVSPGPEPAATQAAPVYDEGPLAVEVSGIREMRLKMFGGPEVVQNDSDLRVQYRIRGERLRELSRFGNLILTEFIDDTGAQLLDPSIYTEQEKKLTRVNTIGTDRLRQTGLLLVSRVKMADRAARRIKSIKGTVKLIFGTELEKVTVINPGQFYGQDIVDARLKAIGIQARIVPFDEIEHPIPTDRAIVMQVRAHEENIHTVSWFDGWMRPVMARETMLTLKGGEIATAYYLEPHQLNDELQMVFEVHPRVESVDFPVEFRDVELP